MRPVPSLEPAANGLCRELIPSNSEFQIHKRPRRRLRNADTKTANPVGGFLPVWGLGGLDREPRIDSNQCTWFQYYGFFPIPESDRKPTTPMIGIMDDDQPVEPSLTAWQRSLQRLAGWMVRFNRIEEPPLLEVGGRTPQLARDELPARRLVPPRL
jgi:hypothetical protein